MVRPGSAAWRPPGRLCTYCPHFPTARSPDTEPGAAARRVLDHVEVDLAVGDAALLEHCPEAVEHRAGDHQVGHDQLRPLGQLGRAALARRDLRVGRPSDLWVDLGQVAVEAVAVPPAHELDVAVRHVVAARDERRLGESCDVPVDERAGAVVVDREEDDVPLADDQPDVLVHHVLRDRLDGQPAFPDDRGQGLGLVGAQGVIREELSRPVLGLVDVAVDEDKERPRLGPVREVPDERRQELAPDAAQPDEHDTASHRRHPPSRSILRPG